MSPVVGELDKRQIASSDRVVQDPATGVLRQIVAGQPIPPDLVEADDSEESVVDEEFEGPYESEVPEPAARSDEPTRAPASKAAKAS